MTPTTIQRTPARTLFDMVPFERWLQEVFADNGGLPAAFREWQPKANVSETDKDFAVSLELPGLDEKEVNVEISGNQLIISGERKQEKKVEEERFHRVETVYGAFERVFQLPNGLRTDGKNVVAEFKKGVLEVRIPKVEPKPKAKIEIKSK